MNPLLNRRSFLGQTTLLGAGLAATSVFGANVAGSDGKIKVGLIGCGGRGNGAVENFKEACKILGLEVEVTATADAFQGPSEASAKKFGVAPEKAFFGYDAYKKVLATDCTYVIMATPPAFRPIHFDAAVEAGKCRGLYKTGQCLYKTGQCLYKTGFWKRAAANVWQSTMWR